MSTDSSSETDALAPVDFLVLELSNAAEVADDLDVLIRLSTDGTINVLDAEFVVNESGACRVLTAAEAAGLLGCDVSAWDGASSSLLQADDLDALVGQVDPQHVALVLVYENRWVHTLIDPWRGHGVRLVAEGAIPVDDLVAVLDAGEPG